MATHQKVRLFINPKFSHKRDIHRIGRYFKGTENKGVIFKPDSDKGLECYVDTYFAGGWDKENSGNHESVLSITGYGIMHDNYLVIWYSKLQTEIVISTTKVDYIALSQPNR